MIIDGVVYIGDLDGAMRAIDLAKGAEKWEFTAQSGFSASAAYRQGRLYLGDSDGVFYCLDAADGKPQWTFKTQGEIDSSANFFHDNVLFGSQDSTLYCLDAKSGKDVWTHKTADQIRCPPTVVDGRAFVAGCDGKLHIIDVDKGESVDSVDIESPTGCTPAVQGSIVYFGTEGGTFFAIDWKQAKIILALGQKVRTDPLRSMRRVTPQAVIFGGRDKRVRALDPRDRQDRLGASDAGRVDSSPVVVDSACLSARRTGGFTALDRRTGKPSGQYEAGGDFTGSPAVAAHRLVIASEDGVVYCFGAK